MPELPEVETFASSLRSGVGDQPSICGHTITAGEVLWPRTLALPEITEFERRLPGQAIVDIRRRGKYLVLQLSQDYLLIHLRMSGDLLIEQDECEPGLHTRLVISFEDGLRLVFNDPRKFGRVWLVSDPETVLASLGPEPLDEEFTPEMLYGMLHRHRRQLKPLLLDQSFIAGLGNIYTDEALHMACLHPLVNSNDIAHGQTERLWVSIRRVLQEAIQVNGASIDWVYRGGGYQNNFRVYNRAGEPCPVCGTAVERIVVGQRGTHFCPNCQPAPD
jgi:formamidopyrimidine-DNA glycosylase